MKIYLMRHGQTVWNKIGIIQGYSRNRLSAEGKNQVEIKAQKYKDVNFDFIISSPLCRTIQTSNIMNKYHNVKVIKDERIVEIGQEYTLAGTKIQCLMKIGKIICLKTWKLRIV